MKDQRLMHEIKCDRSWPICLFDITAMHTIQDFFVFRVRSPAKLPATSKSHLLSLDRDSLDRNSLGKDIHGLDDDEVGNVEGGHPDC